MSKAKPPIAGGSPVGVAVADVPAVETAVAARAARPRLDDLLNVAVGLHAALGIDIPEADYSKVATLDGCIAYLESGRIS